MTRRILKWVRETINLFSGTKAVVWNQNFSKQPGGLRLLAILRYRQREAALLGELIRSRPGTADDVAAWVRAVHDGQDP